MKKVEAYRVEIPITSEDKYSDEIKRAQKMIEELNKKIKDNGKQTRTSVKASSEASKRFKDLGSGAEQASKRVERSSRTLVRSGKQFRRVNKTLEETGSRFKALKGARARLTLDARDRASRVMERASRTWGRLRSSPVARFTMTARDQATAVLSKIRSMIFSMPTAITLGVTALGGMAATNYIRGGMEQARTQEHDMVRMTHWLKKDEKNLKDMEGALSKSSSWTKSYASSTAFDAAPVNAAFATALQITGGDIAGAERLTKMAGDMAVLDDGDINRSMQAIFNAQNGLYEMMDAYSPTKINQEYVKSLGGMEGLLKFMEKEVGGAALAYGDTGVGAFSAMQGKISQLKTDIGNAFHIGMKPFYLGMSDGVDVLSARLEPLLGSFGSFMAEGMTKAFSDEGMFGKGLAYVESIVDMLEPEGDNAGKTFGERAQMAFDKIKTDFAAYWDSTLQPKGVEIGTAIGEGAVTAIVAGIPMIGEAIWNVVKSSVSNAFENPSVGSIGGAALAMGGAGMLGGKMLRPFIGAGKALWKGGKMLGKGGKGAIDVGGRVADKTKAAGGGIGAWWNNWRGKGPEAKNWSKPIPKSPGFVGGGPMAGNVLGKAGRVLKGVGGKLPGLNMLFGAYDGMRGWQDAGNIMGKTNDQLTFLDKAGSGAAKVLEGLTFGFVKAEKVVDKFTGGASAERRAQMQQPEVSSRDALVDKHLGNVEPQGFKTDAWSLLEGAPAMKETSEMLVSTMSEITIGLHDLFEPVMGMGDVLGATYEMMVETMVDSTLNIHDSFALINEKSPILGEQFDNMTLVMEDLIVAYVQLYAATIDNAQKLPVHFDNLGLIMEDNVVSFNALQAGIADHAPPLVDHVGNLNLIMEQAVANFNLLQAGVADSREPLLQGLADLTTNTNRASAEMSNAAGVSGYFSALRISLSNLITRINNITIPSSLNFSGSAQGIGVTAYARGGIATRPHLGLVAEAGVPESMIPHDGSQRSKNLWVQTGQALGMFKEAKQETATGAVGGSGTTVNLGDINITNGSDVDSVMAQLVPALYKKLEKALGKR